MSRAWLVICAATGVALINAALVIPWFQLDFGLSKVLIQMHSARVCVVGEACQRVGISGMKSAYPVVASAAFWLSMPLALLVIIQVALRFQYGAGNQRLARIGYGLGITVFACSFLGGYLFGPDGGGLLDMMGGEITRMWGPLAMCGGSLLSVLAMRGAMFDTSDDDTEYTPVDIKKGDDSRLPVTPLNVKQISPTAGAPAQGRSMTPHGQMARIHTPTGPQARIHTPTGPQPRLATPPARERLPDSLPLEGGVVRTRAPTQPGSDRTKSPSQPGSDRTKSPSQPGSERTKSPSQQPLVARTSSPSFMLGAGGTSVNAPGERTKSPSQQPLVARTTSPSGLVARTKSSQPVDDAAEAVARARTSSSGPIDLAARLHGAPIGVTIKPPLPEPVPVPPDQIPVAPESGLVIRKRTPSAAPLGASTAAALAGASASTASSRPSAPAMSSLEDLGDLAHDFGGPTQRDVMHDLEAPAYRDAPHELGGPTQRLDGAPPPLRGKLHYAVVAATLTASGIRAEREDGATKEVAWDSIVGVIARRLPAQDPYGSHTFVDLVSTAGSTLRILPWTKLDGVPLAGDGEERARAFLRLVAGRCLDAKLDSWTRVFADGSGHAAQLPNEKTLASHDEIIA